ncbi:hypothetical protein QTN93_09025 [Sphingomonas aerolata]
MHRGRQQRQRDRPLCQALDARLCGSLDRRRKDHQPSRHPCHPTMLCHSRTSYRSCTSYPFRDDPATGVVDATVDLRPLFA